jgi:hypothetical protein
MGERPIKVDEETDRLVTELAYFLGCTKKAVVREAVAELAQARGGRLIQAAAASPRPADPAGQVVETRRGVGDHGSPGPPPSGRLGEASPFDRPGEASMFDRRGDAAAGTAARRFGNLPLRERLALRRSELIREFARLGASNVRVFGPLAEGLDADEVALLAETDLIDGSGAVPKLQTVARRLLAAPVHVTSATALALFDPEGLARVLAESRPL